MMQLVSTTTDPVCACAPTHLGRSSRINLGSYYTGQEYVDIVWDFIRPLLRQGCVVLDSSCGYGNFLRRLDGIRVIGNDLDALAAKTAGKNKPFAEIHTLNALTNLDRAAYGVAPDETLIVIGNPPYNDTTSIIRHRMKRQLFAIESRIRSRDLGMSFLLSYKQLEAEYICVLHPLSYLIKRANFNSLLPFTNSYRLLDGLVIGSGVFAQTSKFMQFPILISLYARDRRGMNYAWVEQYIFRTIEGPSFAMRDWDFIGNYVNKYPSTIPSPLPAGEDMLFFYTLRDLNALKRNRTFLDRYCSNAILIDRAKLDYYVYIDAVKDYAHVFPYYFGNFDVLINQGLFSTYRAAFISLGLSKYPFLQRFYRDFAIQPRYNEALTVYFKALLGDHYVQGNDPTTARGGRTHPG